MISELERQFGQRDAIRSFCAVSRQLYPECNWFSVQPLLAAAWTRRHPDDAWSWAHVRDEVQARWEGARWDDFCGGAAFAAG